MPCGMGKVLRAAGHIGERTEIDDAVAIERRNDSTKRHWSRMLEWGLSLEGSKMWRCFCCLQQLGAAGSLGVGSSKQAQPFLALTNPFSPINPPDDIPPLGMLPGPGALGIGCPPFTAMVNGGRQMPCCQLLTWPLFTKKHLSESQTLQHLLYLNVLLKSSPHRTTSLGLDGLVGRLCLRPSASHTWSDKTETTACPRMIKKRGKGAHTSPRSILQERDIHRRRRQVDVADDGAADEDVFDGALGGGARVSRGALGRRRRSGTYQVRILELVEDGNVVELDVEVLVDALEDAADLDVVLELDRDLLVDEGFEEAAGGGTLGCVIHPGWGEAGGRVKGCWWVGFSWRRESVDVIRIVCQSLTTAHCPSTEA